MSAQERAAAFFRTYPPPDADWYRDEVLIPALAAEIAQAMQAERVIMGWKELRDQMDRALTRRPAP